MNITAEQARLYAQGWKEAKEIIQEIEKQVEAVAKLGETACIVPANVMITLGAVELVSEDLKRAGFSVTFVRRLPQCEAFFKISWSDTPEKDDTQEDDIPEYDRLEGLDNE